MARNHAKIYTRIWTDPEFLALDEATQRMYMFLVSQPDMTFAGVVPLRPNRWASKAKKLTLAAVKRSLAMLEVERFILTAPDTGELLVRSFIRNDEVWKLPKVMVRVREDVLTVESPILRKALLDEISRIPLDKLPNEPTKSGAPPARKVVTEIVDQLIDELTARTATLPNQETKR